MYKTTRKLTDLRAHPAQYAIYGDLTEAEFQALVEDIRANELRQPVEITSDDTIIDGHQRVRVYRALGMDEIEVIVREGLTPLEIEERFIRANLVRRQLDPLSKARAIKALAELEMQRNDERTRPEATEFREHLARQLGGNLSGRTVGRYLRLLKLPRPLQDAVSTGDLTMTSALKVASLNKEVINTIATCIGDGDNAKATVAKFFPTSESARDQSVDSPEYLYQILLDFIERDLETIAEHCAEIVGKATTHDKAVALLERTVIFCQQMRNRELAAEQEAIMHMRRKILPE